MSTLRTINVDQRSPEWYAARRGLVTASSMNTLVTTGSPDALAVDCPTCHTIAGTLCISVNRKIRTEIKTIHDERKAAASNLPPTHAPADNDTSKALILALAAERITEFSEEGFVSHDMERGIMSEPFARDLYAEHCINEPVTEMGFMVRDFDGFSIGYSPDGLVGDDGLIEIKAPRQKGHLSTVIGGIIPDVHMAQLQTGLLVSGRQWIDFISYCGGMHLWPHRVHPDPAWQAAIIAAAEKAEHDIQAHVATYHRRSEGLPLAKRIDFNTVELRGIA